MNDTGGGLCEAGAIPRSKYIAETTELSSARTIGTLHAFENGSSGGLNNMEAQQAHVRDGHDLAVQLREASIRELQDAVSQNLATFHKRANRYVGDPHDAEDAVQDALLSAYKHLDQFKGTAKMTTWLTSIVTNSALTHLRRRPRHPHISMDEKIGNAQELCVSDTLADFRPNPEDDCVRSDLRRHIRQFAAELSPSMRKAIELRDLEGRTISEAARILGVAEGTFKCQVSRARSKLKRLIHGVKKERFPK
jgi:RNA polymerase sigma-70 factor (ECF subfamily)